MKEFFKKLSAKLKIVFGYGIILCLFVGGLTFFGYVVALIIGGQTGAAICEFLYKTVLDTVIRCSTSLVLLGLVVMYLSGETALTTGKKKAA